MKKKSQMTLGVKQQENVIQHTGAQLIMLSHHIRSNLHKGSSWKRALIGILFGLLTM